MNDVNISGYDIVRSQTCFILFSFCSVRQLVICSHH